MQTLANDMESFRAVKMNGDHQAIYEIGIRTLLDEKLFYEELESHVPQKFLVDFNNHPLDTIERPFTKVYIMNADENAMGMIDRENLPTYQFKQGDIAAIFTNFTLPSQEELMKYIQYHKQFTGEKLNKFRQSQSREIKSIYPPSEQFATTGNRTASIEFTSPIYLTHFYVRRNRVTEESQQGIQITVHHNSSYFTKMVLSHKEKFNIWLSSQEVRDPIIKIDLPGHLQFDSLLFGCQRSPLTELTSTRSIQTKIHQIYSEVKEQKSQANNEKAFEQKFHEELKQKQQLSQASSQASSQPQIQQKQELKPYESKRMKNLDSFKNGKQNYEEEVFEGAPINRKANDQSKADSIASAFINLLINDETDVQSLNLLTNYVTKLYILIKDELKVSQTLTKDQMRTLVVKLEQSMTEKEKKLYKAITAMFLGNQYTVDEIKEMLNFLITLSEIQANTESSLTEKYKDENSP